MATSILGHTVPCGVCGELRTITDNGTYYTVEACSCGAGSPAFDLIDPDTATCKPPWKKGVGGLP